MQIAWLADTNTANGFYRGIGPMNALHARGHGVHQLRPGRLAAQVALLDVVDVVHVHRSGEDETLRFVQAAKERGVPVVWDDDDDLNAIPRDNPGFQQVRGLNWERTLRTTKRVVQLADLVTTPSEALAGRLREFGAAQVRTIENFVPDEYSCWQQQPHEGFVIGWIAGKEHSVDVGQLPIRAVLEQLLHEHPQVHVVTAGLGLGIAHERYEHVKVVPFTDLIRFASRFDVGIAPLADTPFNRARSTIKLKEYGAGGTPWLASPAGPYRDLGERQGGRLVSEDGWHEALTRLIAKERERRKLAKRVVRWVRGETLSANAFRWEETFSEVIRSAGAGQRAPVQSPL